MAVSPFPRRWNQSFVLLTIALFLFYLSRYTSLYPFGVPSLRVGRNVAAQTGRPFRPGKKFRWEDLATKYPVEKLAVVPGAEDATMLPRVQFDFARKGSGVVGGSEEVRATRAARKTKIKEAFERCWDAYKKYAWTRDEVGPLSGGYKDTFGGWAATLVDSLDTLWIMDLKEEFWEAVDAVAKIDFRASTIDTINVFETTIRHLGGLLAAYDLSGEERLLEKATELGEMLYVAFDTPNRLPKARWNLSKAARGRPQTADSTILLAELGSLTLEFTRLSQLTGDMRWYDAVHRITELLHEQQNATRLPGMWPMVIHGAKGDATLHASFTLGAMADSTYEYLPKMYALLGGAGGAESRFKKMYEAAVETATHNMLWRPMTPESADILFSGTVMAKAKDDVRFDSESQHLTCFVGGMFALGGRLFDRPGDVELGVRLADGCAYAYKAFPSGLGPEIFHMHPCPKSSSRPDFPGSVMVPPRNGDNDDDDDDHDDGASFPISLFPPCHWNESLWHEQVLLRAGTSGQTSTSAETYVAENRLPPGFTKIDDHRYMLRPEAVESVFILYRITGRQDLPDVAWQMWEAIEWNTRTAIANAALADVTQGLPPVAADGTGRGAGGNGAAAAAAAARVRLMDSMESFWMAETLKYLYLVFCDEDVLGLDEWVFNTEAHPLRRVVAR